MIRSILKAAACGLAFLLVGIRANGATITWGSPTGITGDSNVSTTGTLVGALHVGSAAGATVNGVTFTGLLLSGNNVTSGNFNFASTAAFAEQGTSTGAAPFSTLSANYQTLLGSIGGTVAPSPFTLTMSGLAIGQTYQFQWWDDVSNEVGNFSHIATAGNSVQLFSNTSNTTGGLGQFAIGTFVADATTQAIVFSDGPNSDATLDGFQLRQVPAGSSVPLPSSLLMGSVLLGTLWVFNRVQPARPTM